MREQRAKEARVRAKGNNLLHSSLLVLLDPAVYRQTNCVCEALQAMRRPHGDQNRECKGAAGNVSWRIAMAACSFNAPWRTPGGGPWACRGCPAVVSRPLGQSTWGHGEGRQP